MNDCVSYVLSDDNKKTKKTLTKQHRTYLTFAFSERHVTALPPPGVTL